MLKNAPVNDGEGVQFPGDRSCASVWLRALAVCGLVLSGEEIHTKPSKLTHRLKIQLYVLTS